MAPRFLAVPTAVIAHPDMTMGAVRVYCALLAELDWKSRTGPMPSVDLLAERTGQSVGNVRRALAMLVRHGAVDRQPGGKVHLPDNPEMTGTDVRRAPVRAPRKDARTRAQECAPDLSYTGTTKPPLTVPPAEHPNRDPAKHIIDGRSLDDWFEQFYSAYPRQVGKPAARRKWDALWKHTPTGDRLPMLHAMRDGLKAWKAYWAAQGTDAQYMPHPLTFLSQRRWEDAPPPPTRTADPADVMRRVQDRPQTPVAERVYENAIDVQLSDGVE